MNTLPAAIERANKTAPADLLSEVDQGVKNLTLPDDDAQVEIVANDDSEYQKSQGKWLWKYYLSLYCYYLWIFILSIFFIYVALMWH